MKKNIIKTLIAALAIILTFNIVGCDTIRNGSVIKEASLSLNYINNEGEKVDINVQLDLYETFAPKTTAHLVNLFSKGYYNNSQAVYQSKGDYLILGAYKLENDVYKDIIYNGDTVKGEFKANGFEPKLRVEEGSLVMLRDPDDGLGTQTKRNSGKATFAIVLDSQASLNNYNFTVFGKINTGALEKLLEMSEQLIEDSDGFAKLRYIGDRSEETGYLVEENGGYKGSFNCYVNANDGKYYTEERVLWEYDHDDDDLNVNQVEYDKMKKASDYDVVLIPKTPINIVKIKNK